MFQALRDAFRLAVENFREELDRDELPDALARARRALGRELSRADSRLEELRAQLEVVRAEAAFEDSESAICLRREEMARRIGDEETACVARAYADRHHERGRILDEKTRVLSAELADREKELAGMRQQYREFLHGPDLPPGVAELEEPR